MGYMLIKTCAKCKLEKPVSDFHKSKKNKYQSYCKQCNLNYINQHNKTYGSRKAYAKHGLSLQEYNDFLTIQNNCCAICKNPLTAIYIDHNHDCCPESFSCGECVRGLLCCSCNVIVGLVQNKMELLPTIIKYINYEFD